MLRRYLTFLALASTMLLTLAGCGGTDTSSADGPESTADVSDTGGTLEDRLTAIQATVSELRGLEFLEEVEIRVLTDEEFEAEFGAGVEPSPEEVESYRQERLTYELLGLYPPGTEAETLTAGLAGLVAGAWNTEEDVMILRAGEFDALQEVILVHELVHALHDQHFEETLFDTEDLGDQSWVRSALTEGDATAVETFYFLNVLTSAQQAEVRQTSRAAATEADPGQSVPRFVESMLYSVYDDGFRVMDNLDNDARNALLADPPESSEQILHQDKLRSDEQPLPVELPVLQAPGYEAALDWSWGERAIRDMLNTGGSRVGASNRAGGGWGGDYYRSYVSDDDEAIVTMAFRGDTEEDAVEFFDAMTVYLDESVPDGSYTEIRITGDTVLLAIASDPTIGDSVAAGLFG